MKEVVLNWWNRLNGPISNSSFFDILIALVSIAVLSVILFFLVKGVLLCLKKMFNIGKASTTKEKCKKITCKYCGRNLLDCVCQKNKGLSPAKRLRLYKKELKKEKKKNKVKKKIVFTRKKSV